MNKFLALLLLVAVVGVAGLVVSAEPVAAVEVDLGCEQTLDPSGAGTKGEITCTLAVSDLPEPLEPFSLTLVASYVDVDGDGAPSPGDQLQCITVTGTTTGTPINVEFCRPEVPTPPDIPTPPAGS